MAPSQIELVNTRLLANLTEIVISFANRHLAFRVHNGSKCFWMEVCVAVQVLAPSILLGIDCSWLEAH